MRVWKAHKIVEAVVVEPARCCTERAQGAAGARGRIAGKRIDPGGRIEIGTRILLEIDAGRYHACRSVDAVPGGNELGRADQEPAAALQERAVGFVQR